MILFLLNLFFYWGHSPINYHLSKCYACYYCLPINVALKMTSRRMFHSNNFRPLRTSLKMTSCFLAQFDCSYLIRWLFICVITLALGIVVDILHWILKKDIVLFSSHIYHLWGEKKTHNMHCFEKKCAE